MDEDVFDDNGNLKRAYVEETTRNTATTTMNDMEEKPPTPQLPPDQADQLEVAAARLSAEQDRRRMRRLERHIVKLEARLTLLEPDSDGEGSPRATSGGKPSLDAGQRRERDFGKELNLGLAKSAPPGGRAAVTKDDMDIKRVRDVTDNSKDPRHENDIQDNRDGDGDREVTDKDVREAKLLLRDVPVLKKLPTGASPQLRTPPPVR